MGKSKVINFEHPHFSFVLFFLQHLNNSIKLLIHFNGLIGFVAEFWLDLLINNANETKNKGIKAMITAINIKDNTAPSASIRNTSFSLSSSM